MEFWLRTPPSANVTVAFTSTDTTEGTVSPSSVTFTPSNWSETQEVRLQGVDDFFDDGDISYQIITEAATSSDPIYAGIDPENVSVTNFDNDTASVSVFGV